jgi:hypothetical protein
MNALHTLDPSMPIPARLSRTPLLLLALSFLLTGCAAESTSVPADRVFDLIGTQGHARWTTADVPGSTETRPGMTLPAFLVCGDDAAASGSRAAVVVDRGTLVLRANGTAELELTAGTWWQAGPVSGGTSGTIREFGRWTEPTAGTVQLSGFTTARFDAPLQHTELGSGLAAMSFACPSASGAVGVTPELVFSLSSAAR